MKHSKLTKALALVLTLSLCLSLTTPALAAGRGSSSSTGSKSAWSWNWNWKDLWDRLFGTTTEPETPAEETPAETGNDSDVTLTLVEDETTVEEGTALRASTYALSGATTYADGTEPKYFPVTLYNYDTDAINNATHQVEVDGGLGDTWNGIYFNTGNPGAESYTYTTSNASHSDLTWAQVQSGTYYSDEACTTQVSVNAVTEKQTEVGYQVASVSCNTLISSNSTSWVACGEYYYTPDNGANYYPVYAMRSRSGSTYTYTYTWGYLETGASDPKQIGTQTTYTPHLTSPDITVYTKTTQTTTVTTGYELIANGDTLAELVGTDTTKPVGVTLYTKGGTTTTDTLSYANWDYWTGFLTANNTVSSYQTDQKGYVYTGLVNSRLENGQIKFAVPDGGIFDSSDTSTKEVYTNVGLPFIYDSTTGTYTFDASQDGAYFSGTPASETNLTWSDDPQYKQVGNAAAGYGFYPFNSSTNFAESAAQYHFGMVATIPFSMTADGYLSSTDKKTPITFDFAGDDDVWVFIDGVLVLDIGGIHDSVNGSINFAANTTSVSATSTSQTSGKFTQGESGSVAGAVTGKLFNDDEGTGLLNTDIGTFAATDQHTLTVYYLERGKGASNCKISFNLPMKDTVSVHKTVNPLDSEGQALDSATLEQINNRVFGFTLYKDGKAVADATYMVYNVDNQYIDTAYTDPNGHFTLKNGETAKFTGEIDSTNGNTYYVVEDALGTGWGDPVFDCSVVAANGYTETASSVVGQSKSITAKGSTEASDSVSFTCTNTLTHVDGTSLEANDDMIVIDYGLSVEIDVLNNDIVVGGTKSIVEGSVSEPKYGTATIKDGKIVYQLTRQLTGVEVLTYTVKATDNEGVESDSKTATATVYIIPATSMYYEENFSDLVTFSDGSSSGWAVEGTAQTAPQEPGVVSDNTDSPYGSDKAYLNDSGDSNGSSMYVDTTSGSASFSYTFTGTGTSFFARTTKSSGYMKVVITDKSGNTVFSGIRDTSFKTSDETTVLYNIPVFTWYADEKGYGEYTVNVTLSQSWNGMWSDFWLDGIRVINPLDEKDTNASVAKAAYAADGEANMTVVTLREKLLIDNTDFDEENGQIVWDGDGFVIFTDTNGEIKTASEYKSNGPKEEVYLNNGQSVTFSLYDWDPNTNRIYLGVKAPYGSGSVSINGNPWDLSNATDCYYEIPKDFAQITTVDGVNIATFKVESTSSLVSVTNIKVTGSAKFTIIVENNENTNGDISSEDE